MKERVWRGGVFAGVLSAGLAFAAEPPLRPRSFEIESPRGSSRLVLSNDEREAVWAAAEETGYTLRAIDLRSGRIRRVRELLSERAQEDSLLHSVPGRDGAFVFGAHCCSETLGWALWLVDRGDRDLVELTREDGDGDLGDGSVVFSPSGRFFLAGTGFACVGGGHSSSAGTVTVFSARSGRAEFVTELPFEWEELEADPPSIRQVRRYPLGEAPAWCAGDVLKVARKGGGATAFVRGRDGHWRSRAELDSCSARSTPPWRGTWPELDDAYTLSGRQVEVSVRGSEDRKKAILEVSRISPMR